MKTFEIAIKNHENVKNILIFFSGLIEGADAYYAEKIQEEFEKYLIPDEIMFIYPEFLSDEILSLFSPGKSCFDDIRRYGYKVGIRIVSFNVSGELTVEKEIISSSIELNDIKKLIIQEGSRGIAEKNKVVVPSPPGTVFQKPSGATHKEFIKASELAIDIDEFQFVAFCVLTVIDKNLDFNHIYIDTAGISAIVIEVIRYIEKFNPTKLNKIKYSSFGSYGGYEKYTPDVVKSILVVISASTSNNLSKKIACRWMLHENQVITLLSYYESRFSVSNIKGLSSLKPNGLEPERKVKIVGENFNAEVLDPKSVIIRAKYRPKYIDSIEIFCKSNVFLCNKRRPSDVDRNPYSIFVDVNNYVLQEIKFKEWINTLAQWYVPATLNTFVYDKKNEEARKIVEILKQELNAIGFDKEFILIDIKKLLNFENIDEFDSKSSLCVITPVITSGTVLLDLNRVLRLIKHEGNRIFATVFSMPISQETYISFKNSLTFGPNGKHYQFIPCYEIVHGCSKENNTWISEKNLIEQYRTDDFEENEFWAKRLNRLYQNSEGLCGCIGNLHDSNKKLSFTEGFTLWNDNKNVEEVNLEAVFLTVCTHLQAMRENSFPGKKEDSLFCDIYQHAVIHPDNFTRLNDPVLHSCLWRAAKNTELDYSTSDELSSIMVSILERLVDNYDNEKGESAIDMLLGIALGKIVLTKNGMNRLLVAVQRNVRSKSLEFLNKIFQDKFS